MGKGIVTAAFEIGCSTWQLRRAEQRGVVSPSRDPWGRRIYSDSDIRAARLHFNKQRQAARAMSA